MSAFTFMIPVGRWVPLPAARLTRQNTYAFADQRDQRPTERKFNAGATREVYDVAHPAPWGLKIAA